MKVSAGPGAAALVRPVRPLTPFLSALSAAAGPGPGQPRRQVHAGYLRRAALLHQGNRAPSPPPCAAVPALPRSRPSRGGGAARPRPTRRRRQRPVKMADILLLYGGERLRALLRWRRGGEETYAARFTAPPRSASLAVARPPALRKAVAPAGPRRTAPPRSPERGTRAAPAAASVSAGPRTALPPPPVWLRPRGWSERGRVPGLPRGGLRCAVGCATRSRPEGKRR